MSEPGFVMRTVGMAVRLDSDVEHVEAVLRRLRSSLPAGAEVEVFVEVAPTLLLLRMCVVEDAP